MNAKIILIRLLLKCLNSIPANQNFFWPLMKQFVAGENLDGFLETAKVLTNKNFKIIADYVVEGAKEAGEIRNNAHEDTRLIQVISDNNIRADIAIKLSKYGITGNSTSESSELLNVVAKAFPISPWFDAEYLQVREETWKLVSWYILNGVPVGAALQAYARDSLDFFEKKIYQEIVARMQRELNFKTLGVRLCKGAYIYDESPSKIFTDSNEINNQYKKIAERMLEVLSACRNEKISWPCFLPQFATHDESLIEFVCQKTAEINIPKSAFELAFLYGVKPQYASKKLSEGYRVKIYTPYGPRKQCLKYFLRRIQENPKYAFLPFLNYGEQYS